MATGHLLVLFDRDENGLSETRGALTSEAEPIASAYDVSDEAAVNKLAQRTEDRFGRSDAVMANAGINGVWAPIEDLSPSEWDEAIRINLLGTFLTLPETVSLLKSAGGGAIVIVSPINGVRNFTNLGATACSASNAAQSTMAQQLALKPGAHRVNAVCWGAAKTNIVDGSEIRNRAEAKVPAIWPQDSIPLAGDKPERLCHSGACDR
jgi:NAD(P)-dependent dehydrogenase (short-subunit alcohol dehydrogenase family)